MLPKGDIFNSSIVSILELQNWLVVFVFDSILYLNLLVVSFVGFYIIRKGSLFITAISFEGSTLNSVIKASKLLLFSDFTLIFFSF